MKRAMNLDGDDKLPEKLENHGVPEQPKFTKDTFLALCLEQAKAYNDYVFESMDSNCRFYRRSWEKTQCPSGSKPFNETYIGIKWEVGGASGGNCWGGEAHSYWNDNPEIPDFAALDNLLAEICPTITYLQFRKLEKLIESDSYTESEYYGNYTEYSIRKLSFEKLWNFLVENKLV
jgi:hypothetical protein